MRAACAALLIALLAACAQAPRPAIGPAPADPLLAQPELGSGWTERPGWQARHFMVAAANPLATEAGYQTLRAGGSAIDAAIAVQMVLTLVEPQSSGIGGGALLMHWDGREAQAWDGRETAPAAADARIFLGPDGKPPSYALAVTGGRAVATPGVLKMLQAAHRAHGVLPWAQLFEPAIQLAEQGFELSPRLHALLMGQTRLHDDPLARAYFYGADGQPWPVGHRLANPALADVLRAVAAGGADAFYEGAVAADLVSRVRSDAVPGRLSAADLEAYTPRLRAPLCTDWLQIWRVCGFPPPSSGHLAIMQILGMLERLPGPMVPAQALVGGVPDAAWLHVYTEAARLAYADRAQFVADPDFVAAPGAGWDSLLQPDYLGRRAALIGPSRMGVARPGQPGVPAAGSTAWAPMPEQPEHGTSHVSVVDAQGHAVAMTTTIESAFGAGLMANGGSAKPGGYLLNNEMTDFALVPADTAGRPVANRIEPGKRPRSSMSPTLVFDRRGGRLAMTLGSPGGPVIIHFTAKTLIGTLQWGLDVQRAIDLPNFGSFNGPTLLEAGRFPAAVVQGLRDRGHEPVETPLTSGLQGIQRTPSGWFGGADPRREGVVRGD
jgi:gamma-glutamyltranspeptidase/glutathione hydrolase